MNRGNTARSRSLRTSLRGNVPRKQRNIARLYNPEVADEANSYPRRRKSGVFQGPQRKAGNHASQRMVKLINLES